MAAAVRPGGWVVAQEPITSAGRIDGLPFSMPGARHPDIGAMLPSLVRDAGLDHRGRLGRGARPVWDRARLPTTSSSLTEVDPGDDPVVLPPLVTVVARAPGG